MEHLRGAGWGFDLGARWFVSDVEGPILPGQAQDVRLLGVAQCHGGKQNKTL
jgi:hypothetical protein